MYCHIACEVDKKILATLFYMIRWQVRISVSSAMKALMAYFVPRNLGFGHISRDEVITIYTRPIAQ